MMAVAFDDRLITLEIVIDGEKYTFNQDFYIIASGARFTNGLFGECSLRIDNIAKKTRDLIATKATPWRMNRKLADVYLNVGRQSFGTFQLFHGQVTDCNPTQPPDIGLVMRSMNGAASLGQAGSVFMPDNTNLKTLCEKIAASFSPALTLDYQASVNPLIGNYTFTGAIGRQIKNLNDMGFINAYIDGTTLVVTDMNKPRETPIFELNKDTGLIGVPSVTQYGVSAKALIYKEMKIGGKVRIKSDVNPAANGDYYIYKLMYEVASRETNFYWIMDLRPEEWNIGYSNG